MTHIPSILKPSWPVPDVFRSLEGHKRLKLRVDDVIEETTSCVRQVQQIGHGDRVLVGFQVKIGIPLFDLE